MMPLRLRLGLFATALALVAGCVTVETAKAPRGMPRAVPTCTHYASPTGVSTNPGTSASPFRPQDFLQNSSRAVPGNVLCLKDGVYRGDAYMIVPGSGSSFNGTSSSPITVRAENDGGVFIDGQFARQPMNVYNTQYWDWYGLDLGNSNVSVAYIHAVSHHNFRRMCFSNIGIPNPASPPNEHVLLIWGANNSLFEDICAFGTGRNTYHDYADGEITHDNVHRRVWVRGEGYPGADAMGQLEYYKYAGGKAAGNGNSIYENFIWVYSQEQAIANGWPSIPAAVGMTIRRWDSLRERFRGMIGYGYSGIPTAYNVNVNWWHGNASAETEGHRDNPGGYNPADSSTFRRNQWIDDIKDLFVDARSSTTAAGWGFSCSYAADCTPEATAQSAFDRMTSITNSGNPASGWNYPTVVTSNIHECTTFAACPNFYTGIGPSGAQGARNCYQYQNAVLQDGTGGTSAIPLWPWPMDSRIKAALTRARTAGTGGAALAGTAGTGYAANTVTSEIVSRFGAIPGACLAGASGTTPNPPAGLTLTQLWRTLWTQIVGFPA